MLSNAIFVKSAPGCGLIQVLFPVPEKPKLRLEHLALQDYRKTNKVETWFKSEESSV